MFCASFKTYLDIALTQVNQQVPPFFCVLKPQLERLLDHATLEEFKNQACSRAHKIIYIYTHMFIRHLWGHFHRPQVSRRGIIATNFTRSKRLQRSWAQLAIGRLATAETHEDKKLYTDTCSATQLFVFCAGPSFSLSLFTNLGNRTSFGKNQYFFLYTC